MTADKIVVNEDKLFEFATGAAVKMREAVRGHSKEAVAHATAGSLDAIASMLEALTTDIKRRRAQHARLVTALRRIADLEIRSAGELLERGDWKRIAGELQAIANEAIQLTSAG